MMESVPGFRSRRSQREMIAAVANTIGRCNEPEARPIVVIEAGTGIGKTAAYLIPAVALAKRYGKKVIISSATVALQEQILFKDIPSVVRLHGGDLQYALVKGRGRYVCKNRLDLLSGRYAQATLLPDGDAAWDEPPRKEDIDLLYDLSKRLEKGAWDGDRDSLSDPVPDKLWFKVTNDAHGCRNRGCSNFKVCPFFNARMAAKSADIMVVNHDLVLSTLQSPVGGIFPEPGECIIVFDEAHHIAPKAIDQFAASHAVKASRKWIPHLASTVAQLSSACPLAAIPNVTDAAEQFDRYFLDLERMLENAPAFAALLEKSGRYGSDNLIWRFPHGVLPNEIAEIGQNISNLCDSLEKVLSSAIDSVTEYHKEAGTLAEKEKLLTESAALLAKLQGVGAVWMMLLKEMPDDGPPMARWISRVTFNKRTEFLINASPISAAKMLSELIWSEFGAVVLTSATLTALGRFDLLQSKTGLRQFPETQYLQLSSPFDYPSKGALIVPQMDFDPKDAAGHTEEIIRKLPGMIDVKSGHGTLVLFSSRKQMMDVALRMPAALAKHMLVQDERSKQEIIRAHKAQIDKKIASVIFGLASFSEGVDLPGRYCMHVIIAKIPFSPPDSPVEQATAEWLEKNGKRPFNELTVPDACVKLVQGVGRLLRTESDEGCVTILDKRMGTTSYGKQMLASLPPFSTTVFGRPYRR